MFCIYLRTNSDFCHLQHKLIGFYDRDEKCLLRGTNRVFKLSSLGFFFKRLIYTIRLSVTPRNSDEDKMQFTRTDTRVKMWTLPPSSAHPEVGGRVASRSVAKPLHLEATVCLSKFHWILSPRKLQDWGEYFTDWHVTADVGIRIQNWIISREVLILGARKAYGGMSTAITSCPKFLYLQCCVESRIAMMSVTKTAYVSFFSLWVLRKVIAVDISFNTEKQKWVVLIYEFDSLIFFGLWGRWLSLSGIWRFLCIVMGDTSLCSKSWIL